MKQVFKWNSVVSYEETYLDGKSQGIRVTGKFTTEAKEQKRKYAKRKKAPKEYVPEEKPEVETR